MICAKNVGLQPKLERMRVYKGTVDNSDKSGIISNIKSDTGIQNVRYIGNVDNKIFESEFGMLKTSEVVLTDERKEHIKIQHPE